MKRFDSMVIGAGPAGMAAALYLARFGLNVALVEKMAPGGLLLQTSDVENYPGFPNGLKGYELADAFSAHIAPYGNIQRITETIMECDFTASPKRIRLSSEWVEADTIVICSGVSYRKLGLEREKELLGKGLSHCALCDGNFFRGQVVGVVGGGNSALEEALFLARIASQVHIIHRRDQFRGAAYYEEKVRSTPNIILECSSVVTGLHGENALDGITVKRLATGTEERIPMSGLFIFAGFIPTADFLPPDVQVDENGFIVTDTEMRTNIPGVFAAGDIRAKLCRQVVTAVGDGATAANSAFIYLEQHHA